MSNNKKELNTSNQNTYAEHKNRLAEETGFDKELKTNPFNPAKDLSQDACFNTIQNIIVNYVGSSDLKKENIRLTSVFQEDLQFSSIDMMELLSLTDVYYDIELPDAVIVQAKRIIDLCDVIGKTVSEKYNIKYIRPIANKNIYAAPKTVLMPKISLVKQRG